MPSKTYNIDFENKRVVGFIYGKKAIEQSVYFKEGVIHIEKVLDIPDHKAKASAPVTPTNKVTTTDQAGSSDNDEKDSLFIKLPNSFCGLWIPGVSINIICSFGVV